MDLLLRSKDCFVFDLEKPSQSTTNHSIELLGNPQLSQGGFLQHHRVILMQKWKRCSRKESFNLHKAIGLPVLLVRKKDGRWRFCINCHELNNVTKKDSYPQTKDLTALVEASSGASLMQQVAISSCQ